MKSFQAPPSPAVAAMARATPLNAPMLALNRDLGYTAVEGMLFLRRALR